MFSNIGDSIFVTGGAGFIGSHLIQKLLMIGHDVITIDNFNDYYDPEMKKKNIQEIEQTANETGRKFTLYRGDIRDRDIMDRIFLENEIQGVVALAANAGVRPSIENPLYYIDVNINGLAMLLEHIRQYEIKPFVFISSSSVYGNNKKTPFSETDNVDYPISPYAATKKAGEILSHTYHELYNINVACLRYFTVYGPRQRPDLAINKFTKLMLDDKSIPMFGDGSTARDYTYVDDIVDGTIRSLDYVSQEKSKIYEIFNLGGSNPISLKQLIELISKATGKTPVIDHLPMQMGDVNITYSDYTHANELLNYNPKTTIEEGIKKFVDWYLESNKVK